MSGGRRLFLAQTCLQFILAAALAERERQAGGAACWLVFVPDMADAEGFAEAIDGWGDRPFERIVHVTPNRHRPPGRPDAAPRRWRDVRADLHAALVDAAPSTITVFNDRQDPGQIVLTQAARRIPGCLRTCSEDGAIAYTRFVYPAYGALTRWRKRLRIGPGWVDVRVLGTHPLVQRYEAIHPALLRPELQGGRAVAFPAAMLGSAPLRTFAAGLAQRLGLDAESIGDGAMLLALSHGHYARRNPAYLALVEAVLHRLRARRLPYLYKYHPREAEPDPLGLARDPLSREIPRALPVESLYVLLRDRPLAVVGGVGTSLLTAALLVPHARVGALVHASDTGDAWDPRLSEALRILPLADAAAIDAFIGGESG